MGVEDKLIAEEVEALAQAIEGGLKSATPKLAKAAAMLRQLVRERDAMAERDRRAA